MRCAVATLRAYRPTVATRLDVNDHGFHAVNERYAGGAVIEQLEPFDLVL